LSKYNGFNINNNNKPGSGLTKNNNIKNSNMIIGSISTKDDEMYNTKTKLLKNNQIKDINTNIPET